METVSPYRRTIGCVAALLVGLLLSLGCRSRPKAPALTNEPVFQSDEGFRFLVPEGWIMSARSSVPSGPLEKEEVLVQYHRVEADREAMLEVSMADLPEETDLAKYLSNPTFSRSDWKLSGSPKGTEAGGRTGTRYRFVSRGKGGELVREVTAFRHGERVYFFTVLYPPKDTSALEQANRAIHSLVWTK
jgi:hypothetical protein